jgi:hypothetical protein
MSPSFKAFARLLPALPVSCLLLSAVARSEPAIPGLSIYPKGNVFPFLGYSGVPARDAKNGFSVTGPDYGTAFHAKPLERERKLKAIRDAGLPYPAFIGIDMRFHDKAGPRTLTEPQIREEITRQVRSLADDPLVCWWYVVPEEIRFWRKNEMDYLKTVTTTIRSLDPHGRPVWMYEPNHRNHENLEKTGIYQDIIGKGCYVNLAGFQKDRVWVRWSVEQEVKAASTLFQKDGRRRGVLVMPELCADPENPEDDKWIPTWTRHDVYLGLISGARGVAIWSLFPRPAVRRTWQSWYDSYASLARELGTTHHLGSVFLDGKPSQTLSVRQTQGPTETSLFLGDRTKLETGTTTAAERATATTIYPALASAVLDHRDATYVFLCNSHPDASIQVQIDGLAGRNTLTLPQGTPPPPDAVIALAPYQVVILRSTPK